MANFKHIFTITRSWQKDAPTDILTTKFKKAWQFTAGWEGKWDGEKKTFEINDNVASYGVTPLFLKEFIGFGKKVDKSKGEIFVEDVAIWSNQNEFGGKLWWNETDPIIIGDEMNGGASGRAIMASSGVDATMLKPS